MLFFYLYLAFLLDPYIQNIKLLGCNHLSFLLHKEQLLLQ
nr:MAG TPA: hypothetical protein [Caudoviricetes sp.]